jgi:hypothetical protein
MRREPQRAKDPNEEEAELDVPEKEAPEKEALDENMAEGAEKDSEIEA